MGKPLDLDLRCRAAVPHGHWKTTIFTGALRLEGMTAPMVLEGPVLLRAVAPSTANPENVDDARDHPAIIDPPRARLVLRQKRLDHRPLLI
jgi:hypothetical protein